MAALSGDVDSKAVSSAAFVASTNGRSGKSIDTMRRRLVDAQVEVLRMYLEKQSSEQLLKALDRLIDCTHASFREEEASMDCCAPAIDSEHREMHGRVLAQLVVLRNSAMDFDRGRLLAHLIRIDRQLISHIADIAMMSDGRDGGNLRQHGEVQGVVSESQH